MGLFDDARYLAGVAQSEADLLELINSKADAIPSVIYTLWTKGGGVIPPSSAAQYRNIQKTADYTLEAADGTATRILANPAASMKVVLPSTSVIPVTTDKVTVIRMGAGIVQIVPASGVTLLPSSTVNISTQYGTVELSPVATNTWIAKAGVNIVSGQAPTNTIKPAVTGTPVVGSTLTCSTGTWSVDGTKTYQWFEDAVSISGATSSTYVLQTAQLDKLVTCVVSNVVTGLPTVSEASNGLVVVAASVSVPQFTGLAVFTGVNTVGGSVTVTAPSATNSPTGYKFQRFLDGSPDGAVTDQAGSSLAWVISSAASGKALKYSIIPYNVSGDGSGLTTQPFQVAEEQLSGAAPPVFEEFVTSSSASASSVNLSKPASTVNGDFLLIRLTIPGSAQVVTITDGFTALPVLTSGAGATAISLYSYYKIAASEGSSYDITFDSSVSYGASIARISNCSGVLSTSTTSGSGVNINIPALNVTLPNTLLYAEASQYEVAGVTFSALAGWTNKDNQVPGPANAVSYVKTQTSAGTTGVVSIQGDGAGGSAWVGRIMALYPPASVGTNPPPAPPPPPTPSADNPGPRVVSFTDSSPITAASNQTISELRINTTSGPCITIPAGVSNVTIRDCDLQVGRGEGSILISGGSDVTIEHNNITDGNRGVLVDTGTNIVTRKNVFTTFNASPFPRGTACEYDHVTGGEIAENLFYGSNYPSDVLSCFESSNLRVVGNYFSVHIAEPSSAAFTMGDSTTGNPGSNNYVAGNYVIQTGGGVPAGVFGSSGNTVLEQNCLTQGIQAYNYSGVFVGVTVRNNAINMGNSFVPDTSVVAGWSSNVDSTDPNDVPGGLGWLDVTGAFKTTYIPP